MSSHIQTEIDNIEIPTNPSVSKITRHHHINYGHHIIKVINQHIHHKKIISISFTMTLLLLRKKYANVGSHSVSNELHYNTTHTDYVYQRKVSNSHKTCLTHQHYLSYQRKGNHEFTDSGIKYYSSWFANPD